jgi:hypothetical protein
MPLLIEGPSGGGALCNCPSPLSTLERDFPTVDFSLLRRELRLQGRAQVRSRLSRAKKGLNVTLSVYDHNGCPDINVTEAYFASLVNGTTRTGADVNAQ